MRRKECLHKEAKLVSHKTFYKNHFLSEFVLKVANDVLPGLPSQDSCLCRSYLWYVVHDSSRHELKWQNWTRYLHPKTGEVADSEILIETPIQIFPALCSQPYLGNPLSIYLINKKNMFNLWKNRLDMSVKNLKKIVVVHDQRTGSGYGCGACLNTRSNCYVSLAPTTWFDVLLRATSWFDLLLRSWIQYSSYQILVSNKFLKLPTVSNSSRPGCLILHPASCFAASGYISCF